MVTEIVHKVKITEEAKYDYECLFAIPKKNYRTDMDWLKEHFDEPEYLAPIMPSEDIELESEAYIELNPRIGNRYYFRAKYYDESKDRMLMLFFYKGERIVSHDVTTQYWELKGICFEESWSQDLEDSGMIRNWLKRTIMAEEEEDDWVWTERIRERQRLLELAREGYIELEDNMALVKELLTNYKTNKAKIAVMDKTPEIVLLEKQMNYLDECVKTLDAEEQQLFKELYEKGNSLRKIGRKYGYGKTTMEYRKKRIAAKLEILFSGKPW